MKLLSVQQYADKRNVTRQYVLKNINNIGLLYGVKYAERVGKIWVLYVDESVNFQSEKPNKPNAGKALKRINTNNKNK